MAEETKTTYARQNGKLVPGYKGSQSGKSFQSSAEKSEEDDWNAYKMERKLPFFAQKKSYPDFSEWRKKRAAKTGQAAAVNRAGGGQ